MIVYSSFQFAAPPRTGTAWFIEAMRCIGFETYQVEQSQVPFDDNRQTPIRVSIVRHPVGWLYSYYLALVSYPPRPLRSVFLEFAGLDFCSLDDFITGYVQTRSGAIGRVFAQYEADTVMKLQDMPWALMEFAKSLELAEDGIAKIADLKPINVSNKLPRIDGSLRRLIMQAEEEFCKRYDYY